MCTLCDSTNINTIIEFVSNCTTSAVMVSVAVLIRTFSSGILAGKRRNINLILDVTPHIYSSLKCVVYDKLLKPRQSFRITLYRASGSTTPPLIPNTDTSGKCAVNFMPRPLYFQAKNSQCPADMRHGQPRANVGIS